MTLNQERSINFLTTRFLQQTISAENSDEKRFFSEGTVERQGGLCLLSCKDQDDNRNLTNNQILTAREDDKKPLVLSLGELLTRISGTSSVADKAGTVIHQIHDEQISLIVNWDEEIRFLADNILNMVPSQGQIQQDSVLQAIVAEIGQLFDSEEIFKFTGRANVNEHITATHIESEQAVVKEEDCKRIFNEYATVFCTHVATAGLLPGSFCSENIAEAISAAQVLFATALLQRISCNGSAETIIPVTVIARESFVQALERSTNDLRSDNFAIQNETRPGSDQQPEFPKRIMIKMGSLIIRAVHGDIEAFNRLLNSAAPATTCSFDAQKEIEVRLLSLFNEVIF